MGKLKRSSIPKNVPNEDIDLQKSIKFLTLPRTVGTHPETKKKFLHQLVPMDHI